MNLTNIADSSGTDKGNLLEGHLYTLIYERYLSKHINNKPVFIEIGLSDSRFSGASMVMWNTYFNSNMEMYGFDILDCNHLNPNASAINTFIGDQSKERDLINFIHKYDLSGRVDFIIDDGSHVCEHIITTFKVLYSTLKKNGVYFIEDLHAAEANKEKVITDIFNFIFINKIEVSSIEYNGKMMIIVK